MPRTGFLGAGARCVVVLVVVRGAGVGRAGAACCAVSAGAGGGGCSCAAGGGTADGGFSGGSALAGSASATLGALDVSVDAATAGALAFLETSLMAAIATMKRQPAMTPKTTLHAGVRRPARRRRDALPGHRSHRRRRHRRTCFEPGLLLEPRRRRRGRDARGAGRIVRHGGGGRDTRGARRVIGLAVDRFQKKRGCGCHGPIGCEGTPGRRGGRLRSRSRESRSGEVPGLGIGGRRDGASCGTPCVVTHALRPFLPSRVVSSLSTRAIARALAKERTLGIIQ